MKWLLSLLLISTCLPPSLSLLVHFSNGTTLTLPSSYSTLGIAPTTNPSFLNIIALSSDDINSKTCVISRNITHKFVIFSPVTIPSMFGCCTDTKFAVDVALAKTIQQYGADGLVFEAREEYSKGRVRGFEKTLKFPVLVVSSEVMSFLSDNYLSFYSIELTPISAQEYKVLGFLNSMYYNLVLAFTVIYLLEMPILPFFRPNYL